MQERGAIFQGGTLLMLNRSINLEFPTIEFDRPPEELLPTTPLRSRRKVPSIPRRCELGISLGLQFCRGDGECISLDFKVFEFAGS